MKCKLTLLLAFLTSITFSQEMEWNFEKVDAGDINLFPVTKIIVDDNGSPHIMHNIEFSIGTDAIIFPHYCRKDKTGWDVFQLDDLDPSGYCSGFAINQEGNINYIYNRTSYEPEETTVLIYGEIIGDSFSILDTITDDIQYEYYGDFKIASDGTPHVIYTSSEYVLMHAYKPDDEWIISEVIGGGGGITEFEGFEVSLVLDEQNIPHVLSSKSTNVDLPNYYYGDGMQMYSTMIDGEWQTEELYFETNAIYNNAGCGIAIDNLGTVHLSFFSHSMFVDEGTLFYAKGNLGDWELEVIDNPSGLAAATSIGVDSEGNPHIFYGNGFVATGGESVLHYAHLNESGEWVIEIVDDNNDAGEINNVYIDDLDYIHLAYSRGNGFSQYTDIMYAKSMTPLITNIQETKTDDLNIYPNPAKDIVYIETINETQKIQLLNIDGQLIMEENIIDNNPKINTSQFNPGIYFIRVFSNNNVITRKLVIE